MSKEISELIKSANNIAIVQAENPDGDSIGSALALEEILGDLGKEVSLYCSVQIPKYLRYIAGWDRINDELDTNADLAIIVDCSSKVLLKKTLEEPKYMNFFQNHPVVVIDHHTTEPDLPFGFVAMIDSGAVATSEVIYDFAIVSGYKINTQAAMNLFISINSDTLGLITENTTAKTFRVCADLLEKGVIPAEIESSRRELMKKQPEILEYKGRLLERIEYYLDGKLALVHIPWEEIEEYSDKYNPTMLVLDEMKLVVGVEVSIGIKTYPDGKLTGKLRANMPICDIIAGYFGGGGHPYASGFKIYEEYNDFVPELIQAVDKALKEHYENL